MNNEFKVVIGIMRASNLLVDDLKKTLKNYPINATEFSVMEFLHSKGEKSIQEIQKDKRVTYVKLTKIGENLMDDIFPIHKINTKKIFDDLTEEELDTLKEILKKIN